uniref:Uncharacterized protein n=1 Tax=Megaselia scalaris TaxID=36166 RepID=T1GZP5_MEGSC
MLSSFTRNLQPSSESTQVPPHKGLRHTPYPFVKLPANDPRKYRSMVESKLFGSRCFERGASTEVFRMPALASSDT